MRLSSEGDRHYDPSDITLAVRFFDQFVHVLLQDLTPFVRVRALAEPLSGRGIGGPDSSVYVAPRLINRYGPVTFGLENHMVGLKDKLDGRLFLPFCVIRHRLRRCPVLSPVRMKESKAFQPERQILFRS